MTWYIIEITIIAYMSTDHPHYTCFAFADVNGEHETKTIDIKAANQLSWELKKKGWETTATHSYNPYTPRVYTKTVRWMHIDNGYRED